MNSTEIWKPVVGFEESYEVSDRGRVRSIDRVTPHGAHRRGVELSAAPGHRGHLRVTLFDHGDRRLIYVHRLVLEAFVGPCPRGMECCHSDGDPKNNSLTNLRWDTRSANGLDAAKHGTHGNKRKSHCLRGHPLVLPNLVAAHLKRGQRTCRACSQASTYISQHGGNIAAIAEQKFANLMAAN